MRVTVIGGSGFIGTRLIDDLLAAGHDVVNLDLRPSSRHRELTVIGDVRVRDDVAGACARAEAIVNLAAEHRDDVSPVSRYETVNVDGARVVTGVANDLGVGRIIFTSTVAVYGLDKIEPTEDSPVEPFNPYGRTKLAAEAVYRAWCDAERSRSLSIVRPCVVFGEGNRGNVDTLIRQIASRRFVMVGSGSNHKSMAYVGNVAAFLATQLEAASGLTLVNYADTPDLSSRELVDLVYASLGHRPTVRFSLPLWMGLVVARGFDVLARATRRTMPISAIRVRKFCAETSIATERLAASGFVAPFAMADALSRTIRTIDLTATPGPSDRGEGES